MARGFLLLLSVVLVAAGSLEGAHAQAELNREHPTGYPPVTSPTVERHVRVRRGELVSPRSPVVPRGVSYRYSLNLLCGVGPWVDFDGSFWDVPSKRAYLAWW